MDRKAVRFELLRLGDRESIFNPPTTDRCQYSNGNLCFQTILGTGIEKPLLPSTLSYANGSHYSWLQLDIAMGENLIPRYCRPTNPLEI